MKSIHKVDGVPGTTIRIVGTDLVQQIPVANLTRNNSPAIAILVYCEDNSIRYAFRVDPTQGAAQVGHVLDDGDYRQFDGAQLAREFRFINDVNATVGVLQITPYYDIGN